MAREVCLFGPRIEYLAELSLALGSVSKSITLHASRRPLMDLVTHDFGPLLAAVVFLSDPDNVADIRAAMTAYPATTFLFLTRQSPPRSAVAQAVHRCGGEILSLKEHSVVIAATLILLLASLSRPA